MKKKVLFVITKSNWGGAQRYVYDLASSLPRAEFESVVAYGPAPDGSEGELAMRLQNEGVRTVLISQFARDIHMMADLSVFMSLLRLFRKERPEIVHLNSSKAGGLGAFAARVAGVPHIIFTSHGLAFDEDRSSFARMLIMAATWATVVLAHESIMITSDTFERARQMPFVSNKIRYIKNGIDAVQFLSREEARRALAITEKQFVIGTIAELHPNKGLAYAIDALAMLPSAYLCIIGDGELRDELETYTRQKNVAERVRFQGRVKDAARYLHAFDIFILSSLKEGLPYVLLEAGMAALPVVASNLPGTRDIIKDGESGFLVPPRNASLLAKHIEELSENPERAKSFGATLHRRLQSEFSKLQMIYETIALYRD